MSASIEALAMIGANYIECTVDFEERERKGQPPCHLMVETFKKDINDLASLSPITSSSNNGEYCAVLVKVDCHSEVQPEVPRKLIQRSLNSMGAWMMKVIARFMKMLRLLMQKKGIVKKVYLHQQN
ncbi:hypothetical protein SO802_032860 [Lithocarpus litseifolius]|uniref:Uncharacterized protein n=1 Tax=Lithocarpus litseifolius TaxID=425828 RepID=A0AAW2BEP1_9ROSI